MARRFSVGFIVLAILALGSAVAQAQEGAGSSSGFFESVTLEGGPVATKHFQSGDENFRERHGVAILKASTKDYGNWGLYFLNPNSVERTSVGAGYVTDPYVVPLGATSLEFTGALGLVTGYQDYPVPLVAGQARWVMFDKGSWDAGLSMAVLPYFMRESDESDNEAGVVVTSPFLSLRYSFN